MKKGLLGKFKASKKKKSDDVGDAALEALEALDENKRDDIDGDAEKTQLASEEELDEEIYRRIALKHVER